MNRFIKILLCVNLLILPAKAQITDNFVEASLDKSLKINQPHVQKISENLPKVSESRKPDVFPKRVYTEENGVPVQIKIKSDLTTKSQPEEGEYLKFETVSDVKFKNHFYPKGTLVQARVENVSMNQAMGVPADLIIGSFKLGNTVLEGEVKKTGANRSLWVYPCTYGGMMFFGAGLLFMPIRGGHAKIKTTETFTLYI